MEAFETIDEGVQVCRSTPNAVLLDVRTPEEYAAGHIPGSVNHPLERMQTYDGDVSAPIFAYCRSGARSARAVALLRELDYEAVNLGGIIHYHGELER
ncbi:MAG: rhodanese-like domain-containing protein [Eubacteriales bacterium]|nr:rhodanese-like domain-containing protein [Eubacteriales bacterium]